jgi:hypothetical protein
VKAQAIKGSGPGSSSPTVTPRDYAQLFDGSPLGKRVLEDLVQRFARGPVLTGGIDGVRKSDYRAGSRFVSEFIVQQINIAAGILPTGDTIEE